MMAGPPAAQLAMDGGSKWKECAGEENRSSVFLPPPPHESQVLLSGVDFPGSPDSSKGETQADALCGNEVPCCPVT